MSIVLLAGHSILYNDGLMALLTQESGDRQTDRQTDRDRQRQRKTEKDRERLRETKTETDKVT